MVKPSSLLLFPFGDAIAKPVSRRGSRNNWEGNQAQGHPFLEGYHTRHCVDVVVKAVPGVEKISFEQEIEGEREDGHDIDGLRNQHTLHEERAQQACDAREEGDLVKVEVVEQGSLPNPCVALFGR